MIIQLKWNESRQRWDIYDEEGYVILMDIPNCRNLHRLFPDLSEGNKDDFIKYISTNEPL